MAKQKGGLGRGLSSLLGSEFDNELPREARNTAERVRVEVDEGQEGAERKRDVKKAVPNAPVPRKPPVRSGSSEGEELYSSKEDNVTIKGVVSRAVEKTSADEVKRGKDEPVQKEIERDLDEVAIGRVHPNPNQPRTNFKKEELEELAESIKRNGLLQPILVRKDGDGYQIIAGERRWQACKALGMEKVPIRIRDVDDDETIVLALVENIQRSDLNPIEEAYGYRRMMERGNMTQSQVAQAVSKGRSTVANALRLLELPEEAQQLLFEEKITAGHARAILSIPTREGRAKLTAKLVTETLSVRETEAIARLMAGRKEEKPKSQQPKAPKSYKTVARSLRETLQTDVHVKSVKGKNKIEITFKDEADLERLFRIITSE